MANIASAPTAAHTDARVASAGLLQEIRQFWQTFFVAAFNPYHPEQHYMRGPGPACRAKEKAPTSH
ncbi:MAG: hypothetical protein CFE29_10345 [Bradyrhizobiaceae bacterium PARB1]|jgi:hypothetical protein|nr:MAG: hypothetical protein CFE29_10345 [Bradyrhizobiaceae bacterium PARB1]